MSKTRDERIYMALMELAGIDTHDVNLRDSGLAHEVLERLLNEEAGLAADQNTSQALIGAWAALHKRPCPWKRAVEIAAIVTHMNEEEKAALLSLDDSIGA